MRNHERASIAKTAMLMRGGPGLMPILCVLIAATAVSFCVSPDNVEHPHLPPGGFSRVLGDPCDPTDAQSCGPGLQCEPNRKGAHAHQEARCTEVADATPQPQPSLAADAGGDGEGSLADALYKGRSTNALDDAFNNLDGGVAYERSKVRPKTFKTSNKVADVNGDDVVPFPPPHVVGGDTIAAGGSHTCAITVSGAVKCWGWNKHGQRKAPEGTWRSVTAGLLHTCALDGQGRVRCWGDDQSGQLRVPKGVRFQQISSGWLHTCGLTTRGQVKCWGKTKDGRSEDRPGPFVQVTSGGAHSCGLTAEGAVQCWGEHLNGQLQAPEGIAFSLLAGGGHHTCGLKRNNGRAVCWGKDIAGEAEPPNEQAYVSLIAGDEHTCGLTVGAEIQCWGANGNFFQSESEFGPHCAVGAGNIHTCGITTDGEVECWGANAKGQAEVPHTFSKLPFRCPEKRL